MYTAAALSLVIGVSILMQQVGLSPALGAFIAGVVLANNSYKHQLESDIKPFKALLLGIFFIAVGSTINFTVIIENPLIILALLAGTILLKGSVLIFIGVWKKFPYDQSFLFAILLSQVGEFAFVILALGKTTHLINQQWYDYLIATTALSMLITPILLLLNERWIGPALGIKPSVKPKEYQDLEGKTAQNKIVIAGFGDFGMTIGRILHANDIPTLVMDNDSDRIEYLRKMGFDVFYGDATSLEMLKRMGAGEARYFVAALDPPESNRKLVDLLRDNFPDLEIIVRAGNHNMAYKYLKEGLKWGYRENFFSGVHVVPIYLTSWDWSTLRPRIRRSFLSMRIVNL